MIGTVKWFNSGKGYGFIRPDAGQGMDEDVFVHFTQIVGEGFRELTDGQRVEFDVDRGKKGFQAVEVRPEP